MVQSPLLDDARGGRYEHNQHLVSKNYAWSQQIRGNDTLRRLTNFPSGLSIFNKLQTGHLHDSIYAQLLAWRSCIPIRSYFTFSARRGGCLTLTHNQENQSMIGESDEQELGAQILCSIIERGLLEVEVSWEVHGSINRNELSSRCTFVYVCTHLSLFAQILLRLSNSEQRHTPSSDYISVRTRHLFAGTIEGHQWWHICLVELRSMFAALNTHHFRFKSNLMVSKALQWCGGGIRIYCSWWKDVGVAQLDVLVVGTSPISVRS